MPRQISDRLQYLFWLRVGIAGDQPRRRLNGRLHPYDTNRIGYLLKTELQPSFIMVGDVWF